MIKTAQQSLLDFIFDAIPSLKDLHVHFGNKNINDPKTKALYSLWTNEANKVADRYYRRPVNMKNDDVRLLVSSGFIVEHGSNLKITDKGASVLKTMILKDPTSSFDKPISKNASCIKTANHIDSKNTINWYKLSKYKEI